MNAQRHDHDFSENDDLFYNEMETNDDMNTLAIEQILKDGNEPLVVDRERMKSRLRKKEKRRKRRPADKNRVIGQQRKIVNLPASKPNIRTIDGEERLCFKYNTRISDSALGQMPRSELDENEFCVRFDLDSIDLSKLSDTFKQDNCIYPRANVPHDLYCGNRWEYETECNKLAWQFVALNPVLLYGKKGLIQRAVDSYRNINKNFRGRKVSRQDHDINGFVEKRSASSMPLTTSVTWTVRGVTKKCKIRIDIDGVDYLKIDDEFKEKYSVFPDFFDQNSFGLDHWESNNPDNVIAVKLAHANVDNTQFWNAIKATDKNIILKKAVAAYKMKIENPDSDDDGEDSENRTFDLSEEVNNVLDKVYEDGDELLNKFGDSDSTRGGLKE